MNYGADTGPEPGKSVLIRPSWNPTRIKTTLIVVKGPHRRYGAGSVVSVEETLGSCNATWNATSSEGGLGFFTLGPPTRIHW